VLHIITLLFNAIDRYSIWLYAFCLLLILYYMRSLILARSERSNTIFTIEREVAAHKEGRALSGIGVMLGLAVIITGFKYYVVPNVDIEMIADPTPTLSIIVPTRQVPTPTLEPTTVESTPTTVVQQQPTATLEPTDTPAPPTNTPPPPPAACPDPNNRITSPGMNASLSGRVAIYGSAAHGQFQFYKVEFGQGEDPSAWHVINDIHHNQVSGGVLEEFDTTAVPNGVYWLQLTVVDQSGNFPPPCRVRVVVQN
jgi:hypothetical protein